MSKSNNKLGSIFTNGIITSNPVFRLVLGTCPTLAISTNIFNGIGMGIAATFVLVCSNVIISLLRTVIPDKVRMPAFILVVATFVTLLQMLLQKFIPALYDVLGIYLPLIVVNCIILARAEAFASQNPVLDSALDGLGMGLGFTLSLIVMGAIREFLGTGTFFSFEFLGFSYDGAVGSMSDYSMSVLAMPAGGFLTYGLLIAAINQFVDYKQRKRKEKAEGEAENIEKAKLDLEGGEAKA